MVVFIPSLGAIRGRRETHVLAVDADRDAHDHVLGPFRDVAVAAHQVGPF